MKAKAAQIYSSITLVIFMFFGSSARQAFFDLTKSQHREWNAEGIPDEDGEGGGPDTNQDEIKALLKAIEEAKAAGADIVIGLGGGSSLDTAKVVAALAVDGAQPLADIYGIGLLDRKGLRLRGQAGGW